MPKASRGSISGSIGLMGAKEKAAIVATRRSGAELWRDAAVIFAPNASRRRAGSARYHCLLELWQRAHSNASRKLVEGVCTNLSQRAATEAPACAPCSKESAARK